MHPRLIGLDGLTPLAHCHTWKLATATELRKEDKSTNIKPSLMVMAFVAPYAAPTKGTGILPFQLACLGYGKLLLRVEDVDSHGDAIAQRRAAGVPCDKLKSFCRMTVRNHRDVVERRHFVFSVVHQL